MIGDRGNQKIFEERNSLYLCNIEEIQFLIYFCAEKLDESELEGTNSRVIYFLYRQIVEAYNSVFILVGNGFARSSMIILRSMYEHSVTMTFFSKFPDGLDSEGANVDTVDKFLDYYHITRYKQLQKLKESSDEDLSDEDFKHISDDYESVKGKFEITNCNKCKTKRVNHQWSKLDIVSMAKKVDLDKLLTYFCYQETLSYAHPSMDSIWKRFSFNSDETWNYQFESENDERQVLMFSHMILLISSEVVINHFKIIDKDKMIQRNSDIFAEVWKS